MVLKKHYGFDDVFNMFHGIDNNCHELHKYNHRTSNMINRKNEIARVSENYGMEANWYVF